MNESGGKVKRKSGETHMKSNICQSGGWRVRNAGELALKCEKKNRKIG